MLKVSQIHEMTAEELTKALVDSQDKLLKLKIQKQTGQLNQTAEIRTLRRTIARLKTEINTRR